MLAHVSHIYEVFKSVFKEDLKQVSAFKTIEDAMCENIVKFIRKQHTKKRIKFTILQSNQNKMDVIYVLRLKNDKWYVGRSSSLERRFEQHMKGEGSKWTFLHQPINIHETRELKSDEDEDNVTLEYMKQYGYYNVRGGKFCAVELKPWNVKEIKEKMGVEPPSRKIKGEASASASKIQEDNNDAQKREDTARKVKEVSDKVKNEFFNPDSDLRSGRWFKNTFGF
jgi:predicted GIY-YIG superfamily endonuclease